MQGQLSRRHLLTSIAASLPSLAGCSTDPRPSTSSQRTPQRAPYRRALEEYFGPDGVAAAASIGAYRARRSDAPLGREAALALAGPTRELMVSAGGSGRATVALQQRLQQDFEATRVVDVGGWTLGRTELDLCLLAWVSSARRG